MCFFPVTLYHRREDGDRVAVAEHAPRERGVAVQDLVEAALEGVGAQVPAEDRFGSPEPRRPRRSSKREMSGESSRLLPMALVFWVPIPLPHLPP